MPPERGDSDADRLARGVEEIEGAWFLLQVVLVIGVVWTIVAGIAGWGLLTWALGAAIWAVPLFLVVRSCWSLRCPRCGEPWSPPWAIRPTWPIFDRRCVRCGFQRRGI
jgi:hypothetical protein